MNQNLKVIEKVELVGTQVVEADSSIVSPAGMRLYKVENENSNPPTDYQHWSRSTSRETFLALRALQKIQSDFPADTSRVGLYGAFVNGPEMSSLLNSFTSNDSVGLHQALKKTWPPKQHFKQLGPLKLAHLSLIHKFKGPMYCATDPMNAFEDAAYVAATDLWSGQIDQAIVLGGFTFFDEIALSQWATCGLQSLFECGLAIVCEKGLEKPELPKPDRSFIGSYGHCSWWFNE